MYSSATASYSASALCAAKLFPQESQSATRERMNEKAFIMRACFIRGTKLRQRFARCQKFRNERWSKCFHLGSKYETLHYHAIVGLSAAGRRSFWPSRARSGTGKERRG